MVSELDLPQKALTLYQPYAWLVAYGHKPIENRTEIFKQRSFRGGFWIHAGLFRSEAVYAEARAHADKWLGPDFVIPPPEELVYGAILASARITGVHYPESTLYAPRTPVPWHFRTHYGLIVEDAKPTKKPVAARGLQGFWPVPDHVLTALKDVL